MKGATDGCDHAWGGVEPVTGTPHPKWRRTCAKCGLAYHLHVVEQGGRGKVVVAEPFAFRPLPEADEDGADTGSIEEDRMKVRSGIKGQANAAGKAASLGGQLALVDEGGEVLLDLARSISEDVPAVGKLLESDDGREIAKLLMAVLVQGLTMHTTLVPQRAAVRRVAELQITAASFQLIRPRLEGIRKHLAALGQVGQQIEAGAEET